MTYCTLHVVDTMISRINFCQHRVIIHNSLHQSDFFVIVIHLNVRTCFRTSQKHNEHWLIVIDKIHNTGNFDTSTTYSIYEQSASCIINCYVLSLFQPIYQLFVQSQMSIDLIILLFFQHLILNLFMLCLSKLVSTD